MSKIAYDTTKVFGKITAESINSIIHAREELRRVKVAATSAIALAGSYANLENGDFGVASGLGEAWFNTVTAVLTSMDAIGDFNIGALDKGG